MYFVRMFAGYNPEELEGKLNDFLKKLVEETYLKEIKLHTHGSLLIAMVIYQIP